MTTSEQDEARVAELGTYRVLARPVRRDLAALVELAAQLVEVPMAAINLLPTSSSIRS